MEGAGLRQPGYSVRGDPADELGTMNSHKAANKDNRTGVKQFLEQGADVKAMADKGGTLLLKAMVSDRLSTVQYLLKKGASADAGDERSGIR